jgi:hypothetical protein
MKAKHIPLLENVPPDMRPMAEISIYWPEQEEVDKGELPSVYVNLEELLTLVMNNQVDLENDDEGYQMHEVDLFELLKEDICTPEQADITIEWLEKWAEDLRALFPKA